VSARREVPLSVALRIVHRRAARFNVGVVLPDDVRRLGVVALVALSHRVQGTSVTYDHVRDGVTLTLPGVPGVAGELLSRVPVVGGELESIARQEGRTTVYLAPAVMRDGGTLLGTWWHEEGHVGDIVAGGLPYCLAYLIAPELRAAGEAPCYGAGMAVAVALGADVDEAAEQARASLDHYGLDDKSRALARAIIASAAETIRQTGDFGGVVAELRAELALEGLAA
jgi:hypothetical protein